MEQVIKIIEEITEVSREDWRSRSRAQNVVFARFLICSYLRDNKGLSTKEIATYLGRTQRFVKRSLNTARYDCIYNKDFQRFNRQLQAKLREN